MQPIIASGSNSVSATWQISNDLPAQCEAPHVFQLVCYGYCPQRTTDIRTQQTKIKPSSKEQHFKSLYLLCLVY